MTPNVDVTPTEHNFVGPDSIHSSSPSRQQNS